MTARKLNIPQILFWLTAIIVILVFLINPKGCKPLTSELQNDTIVVTEIQYDTIIKIKTIKVKGSDSIIYNNIPADVDTAEILKKYYAEVFRDDTLVNDSSLFFRLKQTITKNDVTEQEIEIHDYDKTKVITKTIKVPADAPKIFTGVFSTFSQNNAAIGVKLTYRTNKDLYISAGYGIKQTVMFDISIPIYSLKNK